MAEHIVSKTHDPVTGFTDEVFYDDVDKKVHIRRLQDAEPTLRDNQIIIADQPLSHYRDDGLYLKARIPNGYIEKWMGEGFNWYRSTDAERRKKLNQHPELHVRKGRL